VNSNSLPQASQVVVAGSIIVKARGLILISGNAKGPETDPNLPFLRFPGTAGMYWNRSFPGRILDGDYRPITDIEETDSNVRGIMIVVD
jgi:hypothetical protein